MRRLILVKTDRGNGVETRFDLKADAGGFSAEVRRLAQLLGKPLADVQEALVCGVTFRTMGYFYVLLTEESPVTS